MGDINVMWLKWRTLRTGAERLLWGIMNIRGIVMGKDGLLVSPLVHPMSFIVFYGHLLGIVMHACTCLVILTDNQMLCRASGDLLYARMMMK